MLLYVLIGLTLLAGIGVISAKSPVVSAMFLMVTMFMTGLLYFSQGSFFPGVVQILIYAGAISVLFIFIVMLLDLKPSRVMIPGRNIVIGLAVGAGLLLALGIFLLVLPGANQSSLVTEVLSIDNQEQFNAKSISLNLLTKYMIPFQATTLLLLAALIGAIMIGRAGRRKADKT